MEPENLNVPVSDLRRRNTELERKLNKLKEISCGLDSNIRNIQSALDATLERRKEQCLSMIRFDKEIHSLSKSLFSRVDSPVIARNRSEHTSVLLSHMMDFQRLGSYNGEAYLCERDPVLNRIRKGVDMILAFRRKYPSIYQYP
jgi:hypothetical protein